MYGKREQHQVAYCHLHIHVLLLLMPHQNLEYHCQCCTSTTFISIYKSKLSTKANYYIKPVLTFKNNKCKPSLTIAVRIDTNSKLTLVAILNRDWLQHNKTSGNYSHSTIQSQFHNSSFSTMTPPGSFASPGGNIPSIHLIDTPLKLQLIKFRLLNCKQHFELL